MKINRENMFLYSSSVFNRHLQSMKINKAGIKAQAQSRYIILEDSIKTQMFADF